MTRYGTQRSLDHLSQGNEHRLKVLAGRKARAKSVNRRVECLVCLDSGYSTRAKEDICEECLEDLWKAQDISLAAVQAQAGEGMQAVKFSRRAHDFPYPHFQDGHVKVPADAAFAQPTGYSEKFEDSPERTFMAIFHKLLVGLADAYPLPPDYSKGMMPLLATNYGDDHHVMLPKQTAAAILDFWTFIPWLTNACYEEGLRKGRDMLGQLNLGTLTMDHFSDQVADQTRRLRENRERLEQGKVK